MADTKPEVDTTVDSPSAPSGGGGSPVSKPPASASDKPAASSSQSAPVSPAKSAPAKKSSKKSAAKGGSGTGPQALMQAMQDGLDKLPRTPAPRADAPAFMRSDVFFSLSWQDPVRTGAIFMAVLFVLFGYGVMNQSLAQVALYGVVAVISAGGLLALANAFVPEKERVPFMRFHDENMVQGGAEYVAGLIGGVLEYVQVAVDWTNVPQSLSAIAAFWLAARNVEMVNTVTITTTALLAFIVPAGLIVAWPHISQIWAAQVAPHLGGVSAALDSAGTALAKAAKDPKQKQLVYGGAALLGLVVTYFMITTFDLIYLFDLGSVLVLIATYVLSRGSKAA